MLHHDPSKRLTIEEILTHPWFKLTIYDNTHDHESTPHIDHPASHPSSPNPNTPHFSEIFQKSGSVFSSSLLSPQLIPPIPSPLSKDISAENSETSETSFDFRDDENSRKDSGTTTPTTAEDEDVGIERNHSGEFSQTEKTLELLHTNESQSTIRRAGTDSPGSITMSSKSKVARQSSLEGQKEEDEEALETLDRSSSLPNLDDHSLHLPLALHSRTPSRTKRRSVSSTMSVERRHSYQHSSKDYHIYKPEDYVGQLSLQRPDPFTTPSEKSLLHQLSDLGFDTGQLVHSVSSDACDASAATWWILRQKQVERGETDAVVQAREASAARRRERAAAYSREERRKAKAAREAQKQDGGDLKDSVVAFTDSPGPIGASAPTPRFSFVDLDLGPPVKTGHQTKPSLDNTGRGLDSSPEATAHLRMSPSASTDGGNSLPSKSPLPSAKILPSTSHGEQPTMVSLNREARAPTPQTPPRDRRPELTSSPTDPGKGDRSGKTRSPSFSMLQRATSAFVGTKKEDKEKGSHSMDIERSASSNATVVLDDVEDKKIHSPSKLHKQPPKAKAGRNEGDANYLQIPLPPSTIHSPSSTTSRSPAVSVSPQRNPMDSASVRGSSPKAAKSSLEASTNENAAAGPGPNTLDAMLYSNIVGKGAKGAKKDSLWTTFRYLFNEDKRRQKQNRPGSPFGTSVVAGKEVKVSPAIVLSRGISARHPHATRLAATPSSGSRRASVDMGRPGYSRRSSSVNSRRSSVGSIHQPTDLSHNLQRVYSHGSYHEVKPPMNRRTSERSNGSHTPTSDREYGSSRPSSSQSLSLAHQNSHQPPSSRRSSGTGFNGPNIRSPSIQSDSSGRFRSSAPASPLHNYHRRATSGSASTRVRHIKVIHETQVLRSSSGASTPRSGASSRASSPERRRDPHDSDYDTGREDTGSIRSYRKRQASDVSSSASYGSHLHHLHIHRTRSPLAHGISSHHKHATSALKSKPLRDVFQQKDDEWISEDEEGPAKPKFAGGLGQSSSRAAEKSSISNSSNATWINGNRISASQHPSLMVGTSSGRRGAKARDKRGRGGRSSDEDDLGSSYPDSVIGLGVKIPPLGQNSGNVSKASKQNDEKAAVTAIEARGRRAGLPSARSVVPSVVEEEEEEEEE